MMNFLQDPKFFATMIGIAIFLLILFFAASRYRAKNKRKRRGDRDDWIFSDLNKKLYSAFYGDADPIVQARKSHIDVKNYLKNCKAASQEPALEKMCMFRIYGIVAFFACAVLSVFTHYAVVAVGAIFLFAFWAMPEKTLRGKADAKRNQIENELPRFLDLLSTELSVGLPIETAVYVLSQKMDGLLASEFQWALGDMQLGASGWNEALQKVSDKYNSVTLGQFVSHVTNAYTKGISIADTVKQIARDIKQTHLLGAKEKAGRAKNTIVLPVMLMQFAPMMLFILLPILSQMKGTTF